MNADKRRSERFLRHLRPSASICGLLLFPFLLAAQPFTLSDTAFVASLTPAVAGGGGGGISEVGSGSQRATSGSQAAQNSAALAYPANVTSGNMLTVAGAIWTSGGTTVAPTVTSTRSAALTVNLADTQPAGREWRTFIAYGLATSSGACTVTVNPSGAASDFSFSIDEFTGVTQLDVDGGETTNAMGNPAVTDGITTVAADTLILGVMTWEGTATVAEGASYTLIQENQSNSGNQAHNFVFRIVAAATAYTVDWTLSDGLDWGAQTLSLKP